MFRCGGCCSHPLLTCNPTEVRTEVKQVILIGEWLISLLLLFISKRYPFMLSKSSFPDLATGTDERRNVEVMHHESCTCSCRVQPEDCTEHQVSSTWDCFCTSWRVQPEDCTLYSTPGRHYLRLVLALVCRVQPEDCTAHQISTSWDLFLY
jgi:hypothetical protein